jgi:hypothetical protein
LDATVLEPQNYSISLVEICRNSSKVSEKYDLYSLEKLSQKNEYENDENFPRLSRNFLSKCNVDIFLN